MSELVSCLVLCVADDTTVPCVAACMVEPKHEE